MSAISGVGGVPLVGLETSPKSPEKQAKPLRGGTDSGTPTDAGTLETLAAGLLGLPAEDRARLAALLLGETPADGLRNTLSQPDVVDGQ